MTGAETRHRPHAVAPGGAMRAALRLACLHLASRRVPAALAAVAACAAGLRVALQWQWEAYGALQLPLIFETGCAVSSPSPPPVCSASRNASLDAGYRSCGWPPRWR
ncbi:hypothetical protein NKG94_51330 [Micromonospora sp. M12]